MEFWIGLVILVAVALVWPLSAFFKKHSPRKGRSTTLNIAIYRDRLDELKTDLDNEVLDKAQFEQAKQELARALLQDLGQQAPHAEVPAKHRYMRWAGVALLLAAPALALALYNTLRTQTYYVDVEPSDSSPQAQMAHSEARRQLLQLQTDPDNAAGWSNLGRAYMAMGRPDEALQAYARAEQLEGESADLLVSQAHALGRLNKGRLDGKPEQLISRALALEPKNRGALTWSGMVSFQRGDFPTAIRYWEELLQQLPGDAEPAPAIRNLIAEAKKRQAAPEVAKRAPAESSGPATAADTDKQQGSAASVNVAVSLAPQLESSVNADDTVFILARASEGPRMPLAIVRKQVRDLPITVTLDDSMAMMPQMKLSAFENITVVARVSKSGDAMPQAGDLFGEQGPIAINAKDKVNVVIGSTVP
jgi:cytochrome c-type biogenesis protein CcmH